jgi:hypothetical protein
MENEKDNAILKALGEVFDEVKDEEMFESVKDGTYNAVVNGAKRTTSKSDNLMVVLEFIISEGPSIKSHVWKYMMLENKNDLKKQRASLNRFATESKKLGLQGNSLNEIINDLPTLIGKDVILNIKTSGDFTNISVELV